MFVVQLNEEDIEGTFGGPDSRSRGYYSSMYASSANAYMLMYRRIDRSKNNGQFTRFGFISSLVYIAYLKHLRNGCKAYKIEGWGNRKTERENNLTTLFLCL